MTAGTEDFTELEALGELADDIFAAATEPVLDVQEVALAFDAKLWATLHESGLTLLTTPESDGGSGAGPKEAAVLLESAGFHAAPVPLAENDLLAGWLLRQAGLALRDGPLAAAICPVGPLDNRLEATADSAAWAAVAEHLVVAGNGFVAVLGRDEYAVDDGTDIAGQPAGRIRISTDLTADQIGHTTGPILFELFQRGAFSRALQTCGALRRALELSCEHVLQREQFGRPIAKFQAVQQLVADSAGALALAKAAADFATEIASTHGFGTAHMEFAVAVAKIESARAATVVARNAHQAHGAIGFTLDHRLRHFTGRALAWRSEFGSQRFWEQRLGEIALRSEGTVWDLVTEMSSTAPRPEIN
ncbi:acyl-CoA dehydrogenase family protein [Mycobacterium sp. pW049]|uniref:acyl-CoA dehydrogenase family protein n=1 Tax=[Mycobacterium] bulgaricum TaxID=3238985 RepID=UPI00351B60F9